MLNQCTDPDTTHDIVSGDEEGYIFCRLCAKHYMEFGKIFDTLIRSCRDDVSVILEDLSTPK